MSYKNPSHWREANRRAYAKRMDLINEMKRKPCADCGGSFPPVCMDFHHVSGEKLFSLGGGRVNRSLERVLAEIAKCVVICANCHRLRHEAERSNS